MHGIVEQYGHTVCIAEQERDTAVVRDNGICICKGIRIVTRPTSRIAAKRAHNLRAMYLPDRADPFCVKPQRRKIAPPVLPDMCRIVADVQRHVERIKRCRTHAALPRREPVHNPVLGKNIEPPAPEIVAHMPQYKTHTFVLSAFLPQTPQRVQPSKQPIVSFSAAAFSYSRRK